MSAHVEVTTDSLQRLHDSLTRNAADFRKRGHERCAAESQRLADELAQAMREAAA